MTPSWTMGSDKLPVTAPCLTLPDGTAFLAEVDIPHWTGSPETVRRLIMFDGESHVVRTPAGCLVWLDSPRGYAFRKRESGASIVEVLPEIGVVYPRDAGVEALAAIDLESLCEWSGGELVEPPTDRQAVVTNGNQGTLEVELTDLGSIRSVLAKSRRTPRVLTAVRERIAPREQRWFEPRDVAIGEDFWRQH